VFFLRSQKTRHWKTEASAHNGQVRFENEVKHGHLALILSNGLPCPRSLFLFLAPLLARLGT
jgi:hypothetical protein